MREPRPTAADPEPPAHVPTIQWSLFRNGRLIAESDPTLTDETAILNQLHHLDRRPGDVYLVTSLTWGPPLPRRDWTDFLTGRHEGLTALAFEADDRTHTIDPVRSIAWNERYPQALQRFLKWTTGATSFGIRAATAETKAVRISTPPDEADLYRGSPLVELADATVTDRSLTVASNLADWTTRTLAAHAPLPALWETSLEQPAQAPSKATDGFLIALGLTAFGCRQTKPELLAASDRLRTDLIDRYFEPLDERFAIIRDMGQPALEATSIAGLSLVAGTQEPEPKHENHLVKLLRAVRSAAHHQHGFRPLEVDGNTRREHAPAGSPEALFFLCEAHRRNIEEAPAREELLVLSRRCLDRWREHPQRGPAPWYTQALTSLYRAGPRPELADAVFELTDWLLKLQEAATPATKDRIGEFGDPRRPEHGSSNARAVASTLAGLADAKALAATAGDDTRRGRYDAAISKALRLLRQLQFRDWSCTWYLTRPEAVLGALRTTVGDNRVDLSACGLALLATTKLFSPPEPSLRLEPDSGTPPSSP